jgi:putative intracellular protease/amidase
VKLVAVTAIILLVSRTLYLLYEVPARRWLRRQWGNDRVVAALAAGPAMLAVGIYSATRLISFFADP